MDANVKAAYTIELKAARTAYFNGLLDDSFNHLERAHILGQRYFYAHWVTHWWMLKVGIRKQDFREIVGQLLRMAATVPGYILGWVPKGNTGGGNVSAVRPMPIPDDLTSLLSDYDVWKDVRSRLTVALAIIAVLGLLLVGANVRHQQLVEDIDEQWNSFAPKPLTNMGAVSELQIIPVVNWSSAAKSFKTEPGVSYLVRADDQTILFDLGFNQRGESPSPLEHNLSLLGVEPDNIDTVFISHAHRDHVGGVEWERDKSFSLGRQQGLLSEQLVYAPVPLTHPNSQPITITTPKILANGIASTGPIPRQLFIGRIDEQALVINLENKGLVVLVGCGHQTLDRLLERIKSTFEDPLYAIVGDLHYPVPEGRLQILGIDVQRRLASGDGPFDRLDEQDVEHFEETVHRSVPVIALGGHDTSNEVLQRMQQRLGDRFQAVQVGVPISLL